jgi:hypothetical protein
VILKELSRRFGIYDMTASNVETGDYLGARVRFYGKAVQS